jgi:hypothetical protein
MRKVHEVEQELRHESIEEEEDLDEARHVEIPVHEEGLHEDKTLVLTPPFDEDEVTQASIPPHEDQNMVSTTLFHVFDSYDASFQTWKVKNFWRNPWM